MAQRPVVTSSLAHVHNKLQEAKKLGYKIVDFFLAEIKKLYKREKYYADHPEIFKTPAMIKAARNDDYTNDIIYINLFTEVSQLP